MDGGREADGTPEVEALDSGSSSAEGTETESAESTPRRESAQESAQRAYEDLQKANEGAGGDGEAGNAQKEPGNPAQPGDEQAQDPQQLAQPKVDPEDIPPERFNESERADYVRLPKVAKRTVRKIVRDVESWAGRKIHEASMEVQKARGETREITEVVRPYIQDIYSRGMSIPQAMARLLATHAQLTHEDENTRTQRWLEIGAESGVNPQALQQIQNLLQSGDVAPNLAPNPEIKSLRENQERLQSQLNEWQLQQRAAPITAEMRAIVGKVDPTTKQLSYPELQTADGLNVVRPLVAALVDRVPAISYAQALECAVVGLRADSSSYDAAYNEACRAFYTGNFHQPTPSRPPTTTVSTEQRAVSAGFSARGSSPAGSQNQGDFGKPPEWARKDATATARWLAQQITSRGV